MIEIPRRWSDTPPVYRSETATTIREALEQAAAAGADLRGAYLRGAYLRGADLVGAYLRDADLVGVREDLRQILGARPNEVPGLLQALEEGRIDGWQYEGKCACLVGTLAHVAQCDYREIGVEPDGTRPAERWFLAIRPGDTPENHEIARITAEWIREWMAEHGQEVSR